MLDRLKKNTAPNRKTQVPLSAYVCFEVSGLEQWYHPVLLGPTTIGEVATSAACLRQVIAVLGKLESDSYIRYLQTYYDTGLARYGETWRYADITTVLCAAAQLVQPQSYLEIGVRRGRSLAVVASNSPNCDILGFDMWMNNYAGMLNPGPTFVESEMKKIGHIGALELISGNSHQTVPEYLRCHPEAFFDLITVDGDHSSKGAEEDLRAVMPRIKIGGVLVFDDICHPLHPYLSNVWQKVVVADPRFTTWQFRELGYGVAFAIRREA